MEASLCIVVVWRYLPPQNLPNCHSKFLACPSRQLHINWIIYEMRKFQHKLYFNKLTSFRLGSVMFSTYLASP